MRPPPPTPLQADASEQLGTLLPRERHKQAYSKALVDKFKHMPEIKRITRHRHLPAAIYKVCLHHCGTSVLGTASVQGTASSAPAASARPVKQAARSASLYAGPWAVKLPQHSVLAPRQATLAHLGADT
jgi:hypothetical protein